MLNKFIYKLYSFMLGRNGIDQLHKFILIVCVILAVINIFINNVVLDILEIILLIIIFYRFLSKDIRKRRKENKIYLDIRNKVIKKFDLDKKKWDDRKTHIYKKCPKCKTILRLPLKKGKHTCKCPKCKNRFNVRCFRNEKVDVEVIRKKN